MGNNVFANGREVACKAADGKAIAAFPDVAFTPPQTPATPPGVPIPYPNTAFAKDTTDGSKKVKISGKEVMLKNQSYFKTSTGDEAGSAPKKGVITSQTKGKVYFNMWSMDVKFEGQNVVRHLDMTTHNHGSIPGNSPPWLYLDTMSLSVDNTKDPCKDQRDEVNEKCGEHKKNNTYSTGRINQSGLKQDMCSDKKCKDAMKCVLVPYSVGCCDGKTPHHVVPAHCFMPPGARSNNTGERYEGAEGYNPDDAPCICASGKDKSNKRKQHARIHAVFDKIEDEQPGGTWSYNKAAKTGSESVKEVMGCDEKCTQAQLNKYHNGDAGVGKGTTLRADSSGQSTPSAKLVVANSTTAAGVGI